MKNYDSVMRQLHDAGLVVERIETGRIRRCRLRDDREYRGWYIIHEVVINNQPMLVGAFGVWHGSNNNATKIILDGVELTPEEQAALRVRMADDKKLLAAQRKAESTRAARKAEFTWRKLSESGHSEYLDRKQIAAYGTRYTESGCLAVPMLDISGKITGLQFILNREKYAERIRKTGRDKEYWPKGITKTASFHLIGTPGDVLLICEGYATGASLHAATGLSVCVAFDANNLMPVSKALHDRYRRSKILICADDDDLGTCLSCKARIKKSDGPHCVHCGQPHHCRNTGIESASLAAMAVNGQWVVPRFADDAARREKFEKNQGKLTDFNDLHISDGLHAVRLQIEAVIYQANWNTAKRANIPATGGGDSVFVKPISTVDELIERFALVYNMGGTVFDLTEHCLTSISDMRDACMFRELGRRWQEAPDRKIVKREQVGFDPTCQDSTITCNLWAGWPTTPAPGNCENLLNLLEYLCNGEVASGRDLYHWVIKWLAYPIQHPGAKMKTTLVVHGPQGTGKNLFFETVMAIYGRYGRMIDQSAIEDKFNDWASAKLFLIADETVARQELYHVKNKLKSFITGDWIRINPKNMAAYEEKNHVNMVFLSNERMPTVLEEDDRRHAVIWTPAALDAGVYQEVAKEIRSGGREALHDYFLNVDLGDFNEHTKPPMNEAKKELIELSKDSISRFQSAWIDQEIPIQVLPTLSEDIYDIYRHWCARQGQKAAPLTKLIDAMHRGGKFMRVRKRYRMGIGETSSNPQSMLLPRSESPAPGMSEADWLGQCIAAFKTQASDYKGGNSGVF
jgi:putative DNA primase/helicase